MSEKPVPKAYQLLPVFAREWPHNTAAVRAKMQKFEEYHQKRGHILSAAVYADALRQLEAGLPLQRLGVMTALPPVFEQRG